MAKKKDKKDGLVSLKDSLESHIIDNLNKRFSKKYGDGFASTLGVETISDIVDYVSFENEILDLIVSNRPQGGAPVGRLIEISGPEGSGKSLIAAHMMANTQKRGGVAVYIDTESSAYKPFLKTIGIDLNNLIYVAPESVEDALESVEEIISTIRTSEDTSKLVTIVFDSVAAATTEEEINSDDKKAGYGMQKAKYLSTWLRNATRLIGRQRICLVFINQLRDKINAMAFGEKSVTPGGKAIPFHSSVRIRLSVVGKIKGKLNPNDTSKVEDVIGVEVEAEIKKNKIGPSFRKVSMDVYFESGIDRFSSWGNVIKDYEIFTKSGNQFEVPNPDGTIEKMFMKDLVNRLRTDEWLQKITYEEICKILVIPYSFEQLLEDNKKADEELQPNSEEISDTNGK